MQPEDLEEAGDWLARADRDLLAANLIIEGNETLTGAVAFHAQQAVEKALKAFLAAHAQLIPRTHELVPLSRQCAGLDGAFEHLGDRVAPLTEYAVVFRYPGGPIEPSLAEARAALGLAVEVVALVRARLSRP